METLGNKYITVAYDLYTTEDGEKDLVEQATAERPFQFISGLGTTLDSFESQVAGLATGDKFEFTLTAEEAYGEYVDEHVIELPKHVFEIDGKFDSERIFAGNPIPLMDSEGNRLNGTVVEVKDEVVIVDMNHPLAGADLTLDADGAANGVDQLFDNGESEAAAAFLRAVVAVFLAEGFEENLLEFRTHADAIITDLAVEDDMVFA